MVALTTAHMALTMLDSSKGSITNRALCAKEHAKNDLKTGLKLVTVGAGAVGTAYAAKHSAKFASGLKIGATYIGKGIGKLATKLGATKIGAKILANAPKAGLIGVGIAAGAYVLDTVFSYANKAGRIDQKYEDSAKIEKASKNVVLEA